MNDTKLKPYWSIQEVCDRLSVGRTFVDNLIAKGMLIVVTLPSPQGTKREGLKRITGDSLSRYESGDVVAPEKAVSLRAASARAKPAPRMTPAAVGHHFQ